MNLGINNTRNSDSKHNFFFVISTSKFKALNTLSQNRSFFNLESDIV
jgi:hypothetical protein